MPKADVYYYPTPRFGHIGINIIFSEEEMSALPEQSKYSLLFYSRDAFSKRQEECKLLARRDYKPLLILQDDGSFCIYAYQDGTWKETPLILTTQEKILLAEWGFEAIYVEENGQCMQCSYDKEGRWQKTPYLEEYPGLLRFHHEHDIEKESSIFHLIQKTHQFKRQEYFYDLGGSFDLEENERLIGKPIRIALPPTKISFGDFIAHTSHNRYYEFDDYQPSPYRILTYNCAHATQDILHHAGYILKKPDHPLALVPITIAKKAVDLAQQSRAVFRKQLRDHMLADDSTPRIKNLIELTMNRLHDNIYFNYAKYFGDCSNDLANLAQINYDGSRQAIERLIKTSEEASPLTAKELEDCIALIDPIICLEISISHLENIAQTSDALKIITQKLRTAYTDVTNGRMDAKDFVRKSSQLVSDAIPILDKDHRILSQIFKNIALAVCGLGVFYIMAAFINQSNTGNFLFFNEPCLSKIGTNIQSQINRLARTL